ncbi:EF-hand domain-containing protein [Sphingomonas psychrotolerans]|uniref:EF-hand domain-containing protein n=1 Tax=Sphingomonas psychrotolerans TaxID=1327635 RepID=A0ABU3N2P5_9SPHN|nr:EF-hand domain-containing protein [Sphingomonas psychrotolerans]MDT8758042.1 EF-hand domain-containing protein [Sphingomonas psychrotolerans]
MWRYFAGAGAAVLLMLAGMFLFRGSAAPEFKLPGAPAARAAAAAVEEPLPAEVPAATAKTREQKRFDRYDKDRNGAVTRDEYLLSRRKAYARLDVNHDGRLDFDEWAVKTTTKFAGADADKSGTLTPAEFLATAPKKRAGVKPRCACPAAPAKEEAED